MRVLTICLVLACLLVVAQGANNLISSRRDRVHTKVLNTKDAAFMTCVAKVKTAVDTKYPTAGADYKNSKKVQSCYQTCYFPATFNPTRYDEETYMKKGQLVLQHWRQKNYFVKDWQGNTISAAPGPDHWNTGFIQMYTADYLSQPTTNPTGANTIRVTLQIKLSATGVERSEHLFQVLNVLIKDTAPIWLKMDTPGQEREDSIILMFVLPTVDAKKAKMTQICTTIDSIKEKLGTDLPVFQYKGSCPHTSVADYKNGRSFGQFLCEKAVAAASSDAFVASWSGAKHPLSDAWGFEDPTD